MTTYINFLYIVLTYLSFFLLAVFSILFYRNRRTIKRLFVLIGFSGAFLGSIVQFLAPKGGITFDESHKVIASSDPSVLLYIGGLLSSFGLITAAFSLLLIAYSDE